MAGGYRQSKGGNMGPGTGMAISAGGNILQSIFSGGGYSKEQKWLMEYIKGLMDQDAVSSGDILGNLQMMQTAGVPGQNKLAAQWGQRTGMDSGIAQSMLTRNASDYYRKWLADMMNKKTFYNPQHKMGLLQAYGSAAGG